MWLFTEAAVEAVCDSVCDDENANPPPPPPPLLAPVVRTVCIEVTPAGDVEEEASDERGIERKYDSAAPGVDMLPYIPGPDEGGVRLLSTNGIAEVDERVAVLTNGDDE